MRVPASVGLAIALFFFPFAAQGEDMNPAVSSAIDAFLATKEKPPKLAKSGCVVGDPTDTPLNVRASPGGEIEGTLENGTSIRVIRVERDRRDREWALISSQDGEGWVYRKYLRCP